MPLSYQAPPPLHPYPLSLHDALPISPRRRRRGPGVSPHPRVGIGGLVLGQVGDVVVVDPPLAAVQGLGRPAPVALDHLGDRKSTRLNSSHVAISYAVFCLKKKTATWS